MSRSSIGCWVWKILVRLLRIDVGRISKVNDRATFLHISSLPEPFHSSCKTLTQLSTIKGIRLRSTWRAKQGPGSTLIEMEMPAVRAAIAAIFSAPTYCFSEHRCRRGGMDGILSLIGSKSKPPPHSSSFHRLSRPIRGQISWLSPSGSLSQGYRHNRRHAGRNVFFSFRFFIFFFIRFFSSYFVTSIHAPLSLFSFYTDNAAMLPLS